MQKYLPSTCPSCMAHLSVKTLECPSCRTLIEGSFDLPLFLKLSPDELRFIISFVKYSGSIKEMAREMNLSYPTVRNYLDDLINKINALEATNSNNPK